MGRDPNEGPKPGRKPKKGASEPIDFWSWHPTVAERTQFETWVSENRDALAALEDCVVRGVAFSVTRAKTNDSFAVVARDRHADFGSGQAVSVFHVELERALQGLAFVLTVLHPRWPEQPVRTANRQLDW